MSRNTALIVSETNPEPPNPEPPTPESRIPNPELRTSNFEREIRIAGSDLRGSGILPTHNRRFPSDHAKWVESPHGHATVSGERRLYAHATASVMDVGR
jgi:hypothetical protein